MNELAEGLRKTLDRETARHEYADSVANALISAQIRALREDREMSQQRLGELIGTKQSGISRLEKADYSSWEVKTLRKLARAFDVRFRISFEEFGTLIQDMSGFTEKKLCPRKFAEDPVFRAGPTGRKRSGYGLQRGGFRRRRDSHVHELLRKRKPIGRELHSGVVPIGSSVAGAQ